LSIHFVRKKEKRREEDNMAEEGSLDDFFEGLQNVGPGGEDSEHEEERAKSPPKTRGRTRNEREKKQEMKEKKRKLGNKPKMYDMVLVFTPKQFSISSSFMPPFMPHSCPPLPALFEFILLTIFTILCAWLGFACCF
jgi:hypothetical protein